MSELLPGRRQSDYYNSSTADDEINLVDLFRVLITHKALIILVTFGITAVAALYAVSRPTLYEYSVNIDIGSINTSTSDAVNSQALESPQNVQANLVSGYIPGVLDAYRREYPEDDNVYMIDALIPKGSSIVQLTARGTTEQETTYRQLMNQVLAALVADHNKKIAGIKNQLQTDYRLAKLELDELEDVTTLAVQNLMLDRELVTARTRLEGMQDPRLMEVPRRELEKQVILKQQQLSGLHEQALLLAAQDKRLDQTRDLLTKQVQELEAQVTAALQRQQVASGQQGNESRAMAMLMIDNEIQQNRDRLAQLEERLYIALENQREKLANELAANRRNQALQRQEILTTEKKLEQFLVESEMKIKTLQPEVSLLAAQLKKQGADQQRAIARKKEDIRTLGNRLDNIQPTRAVTDVIASWRPVGSGKRIIVMLGLVLGLMAGVFAAFDVEFLRKLRMDPTVEKVDGEVRERQNSEVVDRFSRVNIRPKPLQTESA